MNFFERTRKLESEINILDGRTREAKILKQQLTLLWQNASKKDLTNYALILMITDEPVMNFLKGISNNFQEVFKRYIKRLEVAERIKRKALQK